MSTLNIELAGNKRPLGLPEPARPRTSGEGGTSRKFGEIFRFEFRYQLRHVSTWVLFAVFALFGFLILRMVTLSGETYLNAPGTIAFFTVFGSVIWLVTGGVVAGDAGTRDRQTRMHPLAYTSPVSKISYVGARFIAALAINALILLVLYAGMLLSFYGPGAKTQLLGSFRPASYLSNYFFIALPTVIVTTAIQFTFALLSGRAIASYIASILIIIFSHFGSTTVIYGLKWKLTGGLMDLLGTGIIADMEGWSPIEKNSRLILLEGPWLWNRLVWFGIAAAFLTFAFFRFQLRHPGPSRLRPGIFRSGARWQPSPDTRPGDKNAGSPIIVPAVLRKFRLPTFFRQSVAIARTSFATVFTSRGGLAPVAIIALGTGLFATEYMEWLGVPLIARTAEVLRILTPELSSIKTQWIIIPLLIIFYAGELIWRERDAGMNELFDTAPVPEWVMLLGKFTGLALIITIWVALLTMSGVINQLIMGYHNFEIGLYVRALFGIQLTNYLLFALLMLVIHVLVNQKYIGQMLAICAYGFIVYAPLIGIEHNLLIYAADPGWSYSDMRGFGPSITPWLWFKFYWLSWALLLALLAALFWVRSKEGGLKARFSIARNRFYRYRPAALVAMALVAASGGFIFYHTNIRNVYMNKGDRMTLRAEYERRYGQFENAPRPVLAGTKFHVEIYPGEESADIRGTYHLVNRGKVAIDSIHFSAIPQTGITALSFDRRATAVLLDEKLGYRIYSLEEKLAPGDSLQMKFEVHIRPGAFSNDGANVTVAGNGSQITNDWMPVIGLNENRFLREARDREKYGLPARAERPPLYNSGVRYEASHAEPMDFEAIVGTTGDQIAVAPGALKRSWRVPSGRRYFHYAANAPILNQYAFFSAKYALREAQWLPYSSSAKDQAVVPRAIPVQPVTIQIYYHPAHSAGVERMVKSAQASLQYYSQQFGPYPYSHFRVLERPGPGRGMHAEPMTIDFQEGYLLMSPAPGGLDLPYHIMSHEVAHQWWGFQLVPAKVEGAALLVESLATYSAMQVVEETLGYDHLLRYLSQMRLEYEVPRSRAAPPLLQANSAFMSYRKGPFALFALRNYIGKDRVNDALRLMLPQQSAGQALPTTLDFYRRLQDVTPDSLHYLLHDLFKANTFWELETNQVRASEKKSVNPGTAGKLWEVTLEVQAHKEVVDINGVEKSVPMNDWIEIGVFANAENGKPSGKVLYLRKHRIRPGKQMITVTVPGKPHRAGIDPNFLLIDLKMDDNTRNVKYE